MNAPVGEKTESLISEAFGKIQVEHKDKTIETIVLKSPGGILATWVLIPSRYHYGLSSNARELLEQLRDDGTYKIPFTINDEHEGEIVLTPELTCSWVFDHTVDDWRSQYKCSRCGGTQIGNTAMTPRSSTFGLKSRVCRGAK